MHRLPGFLGLASALLLVSAAAGTHAQTQTANPELTGHYRYAESAVAGQRRVLNAVEPVLRTLGPLVRPLAERELREHYVPNRIDLTVRGDQISVRYVGREHEHTFRSRLGYPRTITNDAGREARMTQLFRSGQLQQIFEGEHGRWYNTFDLDESTRRLTMNVVITHDRLDSTIRLQLPYVRVSQR